jgi:hypothetical protein
MSDLMACLPHLWNPKIGDPSLLGWLAVTGYILAGLACLSVILKGERRGFWIGLLIFLVILGLNKQLDLQAAVPLFGKCVAKAQGWYEGRRILQYGVVLVLLIGSAWTLWRIARSMQGIRLAVAGLCLILAYIVIRAITFNHVAEALGLPEIPYAIRALIELAGIALILLNAILILGSKKGNSGQKPV